jgi:hypothetical protein
VLTPCKWELPCVRQERSGPRLFVSAALSGVSSYIKRKNTRFLKKEGKQKKIRKIRKEKNERKKKEKRIKVEERRK